MTQDEKRIKIAEACGWRFKSYGPAGCENLYWMLLRPDGTIRDEGMTGEAWVKSVCTHMLPNYFNDLNACAEMEKGLRPVGATRWNRYIDRLLEQCDGEESPVCATAPQRCEAFGKVMNLW